jgi:hypothetical protein
MGFLVELPERKELTAFITFARIIVNENYNLFDPLVWRKENL